VVVVSVFIVPIVIGHNGLAPHESSGGVVVVVVVVVVPLVLVLFADDLVEQVGPALVDVKVARAVSRNGGGLKKIFQNKKSFPKMRLF